MASLTVIAIMSDDSGDPFLYILGRVTILIGIAVAINQYCCSAPAA